ncbi:MAG: hypothetical protein ACFFC3_02515 [Candidatus Odinarchaeota archaeon]
MTKAVKEEKIKIQLKMKQLIIKRVTYVGDRLALGVGVSFGLLIGYILLVYNIDNIIELNPWFFVFMLFLGIFFSIWYTLTKDEFYYSKHSLLNPNFIIIQLVWFCWSSLMSSILALFYGWQHVLETTLLFLLLYIVGYIAGRFLWLTWKKLSKKTNYIIGLFIIITVVIVTIIIGTTFLNKCNVRTAKFIYVFGIGSLC